MHLHRDLKPNNFAIGTGSRSNVIYIIDFGLSKSFKDKLTGKHIPFRDNKQITGTIRFASINAHSGMEQARRDDLESLGYVLIYLIRGLLPWQNLPKVDQKRKNDLILQSKINTSVDRLCTGLPCIFFLQ